MGTPSLKGKVAIVTGASRGVGKGIALELGAAGATVIVTGRTIAKHSHRLGGTIAETARLVDGAGGRGVARRVDHRDDIQVRELVESVLREFGAVDILVNNAFSLPEPEDPRLLIAKFWNLPSEFWDEMHSVGLRSHFIASQAVAPSMVRRRSGLIVNISSVGGRIFVFNVPYSVGKSGVDRLTETMAEDLREFDVAAVALYPGVVLTERIRELIASVTSAPGQDEVDFNNPAAQALAELAANPEIVASLSKSPELMGRVMAHLAGRPKMILALLQSPQAASRVFVNLLRDPKIVANLTESPELTGRAIAHLATDFGIMAKTGQVLVVSKLAREYGFAEPDGRMPPLLIPPLPRDRRQN